MLAFEAFHLFGGSAMRDNELCHNCDTKPVFTAKIDYTDAAGLLILRKLLKTRVCPKIPAYRLIRHFLNVFNGFLLT